MSTTGSVKKTSKNTNVKRTNGKNSKQTISVKKNDKLNTMKVSELRVLAKKKGVKQVKRNGTNKTKQELIASIRRAK